MKPNGTEKQRGRKQDQTGDQNRNDPITAACLKKNIIGNVIGKAAQASTIAKEKSPRKRKCSNFLQKKGKYHRDIYYSVLIRQSVVTMKSLVIATLVSLPALIKAHGCKGCVPLDILSFDKVIKSFEYSLVKFDTSYPYGEKHEQYSVLAVDASTVNNLLVAEVGIKDYGELNNVELGERFDIKKDDYPAVVLFKRYEDGTLEHIRYRGEEFSSEALKSFLRQHTGLVMALSGCLEEFDKLADQIFEVKEKQWPEILTAMKAKADSVTEPENKKKADMYVKIMNKMIVEGKVFIKNEMERTKKMVEVSDVKESQKKKLKEKLNVLRSFTREAAPRIRDEL